MIISPVRTECSMQGCMSVSAVDLGLEVSEHTSNLKTLCEVNVNNRKFALPG